MDCSRPLCSSPPPAPWLFTQGVAQDSHKTQTAATTFCFKVLPLRFCTHFLKLFSQVREGFLKMHWVWTTWGGKSPWYVPEMTVNSSILLQLLQSSLVMKWFYSCWKLNHAHGMGMGACHVILTRIPLCGMPASLFSSVNNGRVWNPHADSSRPRTQRESIDCSWVDSLLRNCISKHNWCYKWRNKVCFSSLPSWPIPEQEQAHCLLGGDSWLSFRLHPCHKWVRKYKGENTKGLPYQ